MTEEKDIITFKLLISKHNNFPKQEDNMRSTDFEKETFFVFPGFQTDGIKGSRRVPIFPIFIC